MKIIFYSTNPTEKKYLTEANKHHRLSFCFDPLTEKTLSLAEHFDVVSVSAADIVSSDILRELKGLNIRFILVRTNNFDNIDITAAKRMGILVANIPAIPGGTFFIKQRLEHIASTTLSTIDHWANNQHSNNEVIDVESHMITKQLAS